MLRKLFTAINPAIVTNARARAEEIRRAESEVQQKRVIEQEESKSQSQTPPPPQPTQTPQKKSFWEKFKFVVKDVIVPNVGCAVSVIGGIMKIFSFFKNPAMGGAT